MAKWVRPDAPSCGSENEIIRPVEMLSAQKPDGTIGLGARFHFPNNPGLLVLCYRFNFFASETCRLSTCRLYPTTGYMMFPNTKLNVIEYDRVVPNGTAVGCVSTLTVYGAGFLAANGLTPSVTCSFGTNSPENTTIATIINDTAINCTTVAPSSVGNLPMRLDWGPESATIGPDSKSTEHPFVFPDFHSFDYAANTIEVVRPGAGSYQDTADIVIYGTFEDYGQPACRFGSWFGSCPRAAAIAASIAARRL